MKRKPRCRGGEETGECAAELEVMVMVMRLSEGCPPIRKDQGSRPVWVSIRPADVSLSKTSPLSSIQQVKGITQLLKGSAQQWCRHDKQILCRFYFSPAEPASGNKILQDYLDLLKLILHPWCRFKQPGYKRNSLTGF
ncbi:hypothetical protein NQZ68_039391 [Dissostichus eleginoides]|nr:hypothetical protein NQZ68_039391 [Dissostichus eleginoides]